MGWQGGRPSLEMNKIYQHLKSFDHQSPLTLMGSNCSFAP